MGTLNRERFLRLNPQPGQYEIFELLWPDEMAVTEAHNEMHFYTWGDFDCCLPRGATSATLVDEYLPPEPPASPPDPRYYDPYKDRYKQKQPPKPGEPKRKLNLRAGDVLIFEEVISPRTGEAADIDPTHRQAVLLTKVHPDVDLLNGQPIVDIEWAAEDALPFSLCISTTGSAPDCEKLQNVSVARGNVVLVDHGRTIGRQVVDDKKAEDLGSVPLEESMAKCVGTSCAPDVSLLPGRFRPSLKEGPLTFSEQLSAVGSPAPDESEEADEDPCPKKEISATSLLRQDKRNALPQITLTSIVPGVTPDLPWQPQQDLLGSFAEDNHYVVEIDNRGRAHLRFSDGELGRAPVVGEQFSATYRVGNGTSGNVGAEAISHIVLKNNLSGITLRPRNPMAAISGTEPETMDQVRLFAPYAFRADIQRAITADDYAALAQRHPRVQKAAAILRWTGSWYEVVVAIDPKEQAEAPEKLLDEIECMLRPYRRIGHDVNVTAATYVPIDIELTICVKPGYLAGHVKAELLDLFSKQVLPGGRLGFFHPDNMTFGTGLMVSKLVAVAGSVVGVENAIVTKLQRYREPAGRELADGILKIGPLEIPRLDNDPNSPENGKIAFKMMGGR